MANEILVGLVAGFIGLVLGYILANVFRKEPNVERLAEAVSELQRRFDEWQRSTATQQQVEQVRTNLTNAQNTLAQVDRSLQSLVNFAQQNFQPQVNQQLQQTLNTLSQLQQALSDVQNNFQPQVNQQLLQALNALSQVQQALSDAQSNFQPQVNQQLQQTLNTLSQLQQALSDTQQTLFSQSQNDENRHRQLIGNLQKAQEALSSLQTLLSEVSENFRSGQNQLNDALLKLQGDISAAKDIIQTINQQVNVLTALQETASRIENSVNRITTILIGRRSGQAGEQIVKELLKDIPQDWLGRNERLGSGEVEFAIKMPNGYLIPLDSKFIGYELAKQLEDSEKTQEVKQEVLKQQVKKEVEQKAKEVAQKYLSHEKVLGFGIAAVPDSVYDLCLDAVITSAQNHRIVVVPYSLLLPFVLSLYLMAQRLGISRLSVTEQTLGTMQTALKQAKRTLENMAKEIASVSNQRQQTLQQVEKALALLSQLTQGDVALPEAEEQSSNSLSPDQTLEA